MSRQMPRRAGRPGRGSLGRAAGASLLLLALATASPASTGDGPPPDDLRIVARFDAARNETHVLGDGAAGACVHFRLPRQWRASRTDASASSFADASGAVIEARFRSAADIDRVAPASEAERDIAALEKDYVELLGKPVQAASLRPTAYKGVSRWSATWIDANFDNPSHSFTVESLILSLPEGAALELTFAGDWDARAVEPAMAFLLASLRVTGGSDCGQKAVSG